MKRISRFVLMLVCLLCFGFPVYADELKGADGWTAEFTSNKEMVSNFSAQNFADVLDYMQPGDSARFRVRILNSYSVPTDWYMTNKVIESMEDMSKTAKGGVYSYKLTYTNPEGSTRVLYDSDVVGGESYRQGLEGLHEATDNLKDYFYLDNLAQSESGFLELFVLLDGETQGNDYQDTIAKLQMNFAVELPKEEVRKDKPKYIERKTDGEHIIIYEEDVVVDEPGPTRIVHTGDERSLLIWFVIAGLLGIIMLLLGAISIRLRKYLGMFLLACFLLGASMEASASEAYFSDEYLYTVRIFSGTQGKFKDGTDCVMLQVKPGMTIDLTYLLEDMEKRMADSKYYPKGIRESGKDNNTVNHRIGPVYRITRDTDLVLAYAIKGGDVSYTIRYVNAKTGEELLPSKTFNGNVGEKPVVAYKYVSGFVPQAYNITKTLDADSAKNIFTFYYTESPNGGVYIRIEEGETIYITEPGERTEERIPGQVIHIQGEETIVVIDDGRQGQPHGTNTGGEQTDTGAGEDSENAPDEGPADIIDLDEPEVPLSQAVEVLPMLSDDYAVRERVITFSDFALFVLILFLLLIILVLTLVFISIKKKRREEIDFEIQQAKKKQMQRNLAIISDSYKKMKEDKENEEHE